MATTTGKLNINSNYQLNSGYKIPILGYGVYKTPVDVTESVTLDALKSGYHHIDSATIYGNEQPCAEAMRKSGLSRSDIFFTSKVPPKDINYAAAKKSIETSLAQTGLEYVDLYLLHAPYGGKEGRLGAWKALVEAQREGKVRSIGVSNYGVHHLEELEAYIKSSGEGSKIDVNQVELHPWLPRSDIVEWCKARNIVMEAYCPIVRGARSNELVLQRLSEKHSKSWAQILLRWSLQKGFVPLPKSETPKRIQENADIFDFELDEDDMKSLHIPTSYEPCAWDPTISKE